MTAPSSKQDRGGHARGAEVAHPRGERASAHDHRVDLAVVALEGRQLEGEAPGAAPGLGEVEPHQHDVGAPSRRALARRAAWLTIGREPSRAPIPSASPPGVRARTAGGALSTIDATLLRRQRSRRMIPRYTPPEFAELWSAARATRHGSRWSSRPARRWRPRASSPPAPRARLRDQKLALDPERIDAIERTVKHDVIAFLTHVEELGGAEARWLHRGMTSSDVLDTSLAMLLVRAAEPPARPPRRARWRRSPAAPTSTAGRR